MFLVFKLCEEFPDVSFYFKRCDERSSLAGTTKVRVAFVTKDMEIREKMWFFSDGERTMGAAFDVMVEEKLREMALQVQRGY